MSEITYILCLITSIISAVLLALRARGPSGQLMFWGAIFFVGMALNNALMFADAVAVPATDWSVVPNLVALASIAVLLYALIWEST
jgi:hypothetical protein